MYEHYKLTCELVPETCWYSNVRSNVSPSDWDTLRIDSYNKANNRCEICGQTGKEQGFKHNVECHEIWEYNDEIHVQRLVSLISLCPLCHKVKHPGLAGIRGEMAMVINKLMEVNNITEGAAEEYIEYVFSVWRERSQHQWTLDITHLEKLLPNLDGLNWWEKIVKGT